VKISQSHAQLTHFTERSTEQGKQAHFAQLPYKSRHSIKHLGARSGTTAQPHGATRGSDAVGGSVGGASALQRTDTNLHVIKHTEIRRVLGYGGIRAPPPPRNKIQETRLKTKILSAKRRFVIIPEHNQEISRIMNDPPPPQSSESLAARGPWTRARSVPGSCPSRVLRRCPAY
jgi:hypothetical protein